MIYFDDTKYNITHRAKQNVRPSMNQCATPEALMNRIMRWTCPRSRPRAAPAIDSVSCQRQPAQLSEAAALGSVDRRPRQCLHTHVAASSMWMWPLPWGASPRSCSHVGLGGAAMSMGGGRWSRCRRHGSWLLSSALRTTRRRHGAAPVLSPLGGICTANETRDSDVIFFPRWQTAPWFHDPGAS